MSSLPRVFVSSTFYDLRHLRNTLATFLETDLGYRAVLSEHSTFPVDPDADTVENCRRRVEQDADVCVLVVGNRYGSVPATQQLSVTNIEYLTAKALGLPCFVFVQSEVLALLPTWEANPQADFSRTVDSPKLFGFVDGIRRAEGRWVFGFNVPTEIIDILRTQLAYLMFRGLTLQARLSNSDGSLSGLHGIAFRLAVEKPLGWQARLLAEVVRQGVAESEDAYRAYAIRVAFGSGQIIQEDNAAEWLHACFEQALRLSGGITSVINDSLATALNSDDPSVISSGGRQIVEGYREAIDWAARVRRAHVPEDWAPMRDAVALMTREIIGNLRAFPGDFIQALDHLLATAEGPSATLNYTFTIPAPDTAAFNTALKELHRKRGLT